VASSNGVTPLAVSAGQKLLVELQGVAPASTPAGGVTENLQVSTGIPGDDFIVPLTLEVGLVTTFLSPPYDINNPMPITVGKSLVPHVLWQFTWRLGPAVNVEFRLDTADTSGFIAATFEDHGPYVVGDGVNTSNFIKFHLLVTAPGILTLVRSKSFICG
jgi:hypothetical protein